MRKSSTGNEIDVETSTAALAGEWGEWEAIGFSCKTTIYRGDSAGRSCVFRSNSSRSTGEDIADEKFKAGQHIAAGEGVVFAQGLGAFGRMRHDGAAFGIDQPN